MTEAEILAHCLFDTDADVVVACTRLQTYKPILVHHPSGGYVCALCHRFLASGLINHLRQEHYADALRADRKRFFLL